MSCILTSVAMSCIVTPVAMPCIMILDAMSCVMILILCLQARLYMCTFTCLVHVHVVHVCVVVIIVSLQVHTVSHQSCETPNDSTLLNSE